MLAAEIVTLRKAAGALGEALARIDTLEAALWGARRAHAAKCELRPGRALHMHGGRAQRQDRRRAGSTSRWRIVKKWRNA